MIPDINEDSIVVLLDVSAAMVDVLDALIKQLMFDLNRHFRKASSGSLFNIIAFSSQVKSFSDNVIPYTGECMVSLRNWLQERCYEIHYVSKSADFKRNILDSLVFGLEDAMASAVIVITSGLPDQEPQDIVKCAKKLSHGRPVHAVYIQIDIEDGSVFRFLNFLTKSTGGLLLKTHQNEIISKWNCSTMTESKALLERKSHLQLGVKDSLMHVPSEGSNHADFSVLKQGIGASLSIRQKSELSSSSLPASLLLMKGKTVLARRKLYGDFHLGVIVDVIAPSKFAILFDINDTTSDEIPIKDIVSYEDAKRHEVSKGDKVLAPYLSHGRYAPGTVVQDKLLSAEGHVLVKVLHGDNLKLKAEDVIRIPEQLYERLLAEGVPSVINSSRSNSAGAVDEYIQFLESCKQKKLLKARDLTWRRHHATNLKRSVVKPRVLDELNLSCDSERGATGDESDGDSDSSISDAVTRHRPGLLLNTPSHRIDDVPVGNRTRSKSADCLKSPRPPSKRRPKKRNRVAPKRWVSTATGSGRMRNVVSSAGRPIPCDTSNLRASRARYATYDSDPNCRPDHVEYQSANGVPFPSATDRHLRSKSNSTWSPDKVSVTREQAWRHHDIISHRTVDYGKVVGAKPNPIPVSAEGVDKNLVNELNTRRAVYEEKLVVERENREQQLAKRAQKLRKQHHDRDRDSRTKIEITIESDQQRLKIKKNLKENQLEFEQARESKNQEWKKQRLEALRKKREEQSKNDEAKLHVARVKEEDKLNSNLAASQKRGDIDKSKLEKEIELVEGKLNRLKAVRRRTDAKLDAVKRDNDAHRDMGNYVKNHAFDRVRSYVLP